MAAGKPFREKPYVANPHVRLEDASSASEEPRRNALSHKGICTGRGCLGSFPLRAAGLLAIALILQTSGVERELTGAEGWAGIMAHPAVLNPSCGYPVGTVLNLGGEWEFKGFSGDVTANRKPGRSFYSRSDWGCNGNKPGELPLRPIRVPGCWEAQGVGVSGVSEPWIMSDNQRMPLRHKFMGEGWYRRWVDIPAAWKNCRIWLKLGGLRGEAHVWVNDSRVALINDYCATRKFEVTHFVTPGQTAKVVIELDNRAATSSGCLVGRNRWGGILRSPELEATPQWLIDDVWARGDFDRREAEIRVWTARPEGKADDGAERKLKVSIEGSGEEQLLSDVSDGQVFRVPLVAFRPWSPKCPNLYTARVDLVEGGTVVQTRFERFGVRKLETAGSDLRLNGELFFVRGFGDDAVYPISGSTVGDRDFHRAHLAKARAAGFNQVRLHSHCEMPEYFDAADELGILVQPELPYYNDCCTEYGVYDPLRHLRELHENYRNHPALAIYGMGNEGSHGKWMDRALYRLAKAIDPDRLAISQSGHFEGNTPDIADFDEAHQRKWEGKRGPSIDRTRPFTIHEYLNLCIKTDYRTAKDYMGVWLPPETAARREAFLAKSGLGMEWGARLQDAQTSLQRFWQKDGVESARLDAGCDGFCFWTIVDVVVYNARSDAYSAQGLFDPFWRPKRGGLEPKDFAVFNSPSCVLLSIAATNRVYASGERLVGDILFAHYENAPVEDARVEWRLTTDGGCVLSEGGKNLNQQHVGPVRKVASLDMDVPAVKTPCRVWLSTTVCGNAAGHPFAQSNHWPFWFFPTNGVAGDIQAEARTKGVVVASEDSPDAVAALREGRPAVIVGKAEKVPNVKLGWWWMGPQMGFAVRSNACLDGFPHDGTLSPLWFRIVGEGRDMSRQKIPEQDAVIVGEGGETCYCYLAQTPLPKGGCVVRTWGLDVMSSLPEARFLLHTLVSAAAPNSASPNSRKIRKKLSPEERIRQIAPVKAGELRLRPTFNSCGVCWGAGREIADIRLNWRRRGEQAWQAVPELPYFPETKDCRASILGLAEDTDYEMNISAAGCTLAEGSFRTWKSEVPIARTVEIDPATATFPIEISAKGRPDGWVRYTTKDGRPLANATTNTTLSVKGAEHVIIENIDFRGCRGTAVVRVDECTGVRIRNCEFSGFGREVCMDFFKCGLGIYWPCFGWKGYDTAIRIGTGTREVVVERCYLHDAHYPSSSWIYSHPCGPNAIYMCKPDHSTVLRWNDLVGSDEIRWNDAVEGCGNFHADGGFNRDADIYGNFMIFSNDDAIELDGGNQNVRCFGNRFESKVSIQGTTSSRAFATNLAACSRRSRPLASIWSRSAQASTSSATRLSVPVSP